MAQPSSETQKTNSETENFGRVIGRVKVCCRRLYLLVILFFSFACLPQPVPTPQPTSSNDFVQKSPEPLPTGPVIGAITTNLIDYPNRQVPRYEKLELTFEVDTVAQNLQWPYDPSPPPGLEPELGITVDALFTPDDWQTVYTQPAFYYQEFEHQLKNDRDWIYPTGNYAWKVRFAPNRVGDWQFKIKAADASGTTETAPQTFKVALSANRGFIRVSATDSRYFEYDDGTYFPGLSYNSGYREIDLINPTGSRTQDTLQDLGDNNIQLIRLWLSSWAIFGSTWNPWKSHNPVHNLQEPDARLRHETVAPFDGAEGSLAVPGSEVFLWLSPNETVDDDGIQWDFAPCMLMGWESAPVPLKRNTEYRLRVRYKDLGLTGPRVAGKPYGFVVKTGGWLWDNNDETKRCYFPGAGNLLAATYNTTPQWRNYSDPDHPGWRILEGDFNSGDADFIDKLYLAIENATSSTGATGVLVDHIWIEEELGGGQYGPNVIYKSWMAHHQYFDQRNSYALDRVIELAKQHDLYFKLVIHEKQDYVLNIFEFDGSLSTYLPYENPVRLFYGNGRERSGKTKIRWLEEAWWRYLQARWGYSPHIHSWELLNEGNPANTSHYILTDELGKYMHQFAPNDHLVTTSFWHSFPGDVFWSNADYPDVDYADVHQYVYQDDDPTFDDTALNTQMLSLQYGAHQPNGPNKPVMRGEVGWIFDETDDFFAQNSSKGLWLHNFVWGGINAGGLIESYWGGSPTYRHIYNSDSHDHRSIFKTYYNFIADIPLNNGHYQDAQAVSSQPDLRVWGQKDVDHGCAHLWIQNRKHIWKNIVDSVPIPAVSGIVTIPGFQPNEVYTIEWWDPYQANKAQQITRIDSITAQPDGAISISVDNLASDVAFKIIAGDDCTP